MPGAEWLRGAYQTAALLSANWRVEKRNRGCRNVHARLCHPLRKCFCSAGFRADVFIIFHIRQGSVPTQEREVLAVWLAQPPVIGFALQVQAIVASVWRVYFHTLPLFVFLSEAALSLISLRGRCSGRHSQRLFL